MPGLADLLPLAAWVRSLGGPQFGSLLPKSPTNVTAGSPPAPTPPPQSSDAQFLQAMTQMGLAGPQNELHRAQAEQARALAKYFGTDDPPPPGFGQRGGTGDVSGGSAFGSLSGPMPAPAAATLPLDALLSPAMQPRPLGGGMASGMGPPGRPTRAELAWTQNAPIPTLANPGVPRDAWQHGVMSEAPPIPPPDGYAPQYPFGDATPRGQFQTGHMRDGKWVPTWATNQLPPPRLATNAPPASMSKGALLGSVPGVAAAGGAPIQMAQAGPAGPAFGSLAPGYSSPFSAEDIAWAQRQDQRNAKLGKRNPAMVDEALKMAPGMSMSPQYKASVALAEEGARDPFLRGRAQFQADLDLRNKWGSPTDLQKALLAANINPNSPQGREIMARAFPDNRPDAVKLADAANLPTDQRGPAIAGAIPGNAPTGDQKDYRAYVNDQLSRKQPVKGFEEWDISRRRAQNQNEFGTIPPGHQLSRGEGGAVSMAPIPGSPAEREAKDAERKLKLAEANKKIGSDIVIQEVGRAFKLMDESTLPTTGGVGAFLSKIPYTASHDLSNLITTIEANAMVDKLQAMRQASPTGAGLGNVTERENERLVAAIGSLKQSQSDGQFRTNLQRVKDIYLEIVHGPDGPRLGAESDKPPGGQRRLIWDPQSQSLRPAQ
jgi:hypothetical protein